MGCVGPVSPGVSTSLAKDHCSPGCQNKEYLQDEVKLPFAPVAGVFQGCLQRLQQAPFGGILASDRRAIWHYAETQRGVHLGGSRRDGKAVAHLPLPRGLGAGAGALLGTSAEMCVPRWRERGPCQTLPSWGPTERQQEK